MARQKAKGVCTEGRLAVYFTLAEQAAIREVARHEDRAVSWWIRQAALAALGRAKGRAK